MSEDIASLPADMGGLVSSVVASVFGLGARSTRGRLQTVRRGLLG
jgi:hypothetical protein